MKASPAAYRRKSFTKPGRFSRRDIILTLTCLGLLYFLYTTQWSSSSHHNRQKLPESVRLELYMNSDRDPIPFTPSSFNWSTVSYAHPPPPNLPLPKGRINKLPQIQATFPKETPQQYELRESRRREVRRLFQKNWASYRKHAWMRDALLPVSGQGRDQFSGWAATLVDALDTLWMMGLRDEFEEAVAAVGTIDFGKSTNPRVNMFETNIRYLGGLLGAYDLSGREVLLAKAVELGDMLFAGFNTENRMPVDFFSMDESQRGGGLIVEGQVVNAAAGTLTMEFTRLSQVTGDPKYYTAISHLVTVFEKGQGQTKLPGMWPTMVSMSRMDVVSGGGFTLGSGADSTYEYMTKMYPLLGGKEKRYQKMSIDWMDAADNAMFYRPMLPDDNDILFAGNLDFYGENQWNLDPESEHLECFLGATYALGGRLFDRKDYIDVGAKLGLGCAYAYNITATGMMCERFNMVKCDARSTCHWNQTRWEAEKTAKGLWREGVPLGFTSCKDARYILRPEAIESIFYLWRITGDAKYQQTAWEMFAAVGNGTLTEFANAAVLDVTSLKRPLAKEDYMEVSTIVPRFSQQCTNVLSELLACGDDEVFLPGIVTARFDISR